jgi:hypothetical protein
MKVRLTRKLAEEIDGIDLSDHHAGDVMQLPDPDARTLMAEGWAIEERRESELRNQVLAFRRSTDPGHWPHDDEDDMSGAW